MKRFLSVLVLALFVVAVPQGCSLTYWHSECEHGFKRTEFGLLGSGGPGGIPGLIPIYRQNVQIAEPDEPD